MKCIYTNAHSMGNKHEELEAIEQQKNYDMVALMETWWMIHWTTINCSEQTGEEEDVVE